MKNTRHILTTIFVFAVLPGRAEALTNSNFEATPFSTGWTVAGAPIVTPGLRAGSLQGARFTGAAQALTQNVVWGADWYLDCYFAIRSTAGRAFSLIIYNGSNIVVNLRYELGTFATFDGTSWGSGLGLGTCNASVDANADGDLDDAGDTKNVYHMRITGHGFGTAAANYDVEISDANDAAFTHIAAGLARYQNVSGTTVVPTSVAFSTQFGSNPGFWIDDVFSHQEGGPTIRSFTTDAGNIGGPGLPASTRLSWLVENGDAISIGGIGPVAASGSAIVAPASATTYTLVATRTLSGVSATASVVIAVNATQLAPRINEFAAADGLLEDENGDRPDWLEIFNPNTFTLNLAGFTLTDSALTLAQWTFPLANVAPGKYLVVFASGKDRAVAGSPLHTNFSLTASGEYLAISAPGGPVLQQFPTDYPATLLFPKQYDRLSYGFDGAGALKYFKPATPRAANGAGFDSVVAERPSR